MPAAFDTEISLFSSAKLEGEPLRFLQTIVFLESKIFADCGETQWLLLLLYHNLSGAFE